jgi:hypothetical protein
MKKGFVLGAFLTLVGVGLCYTGILAMGHGSVSGGPIIWVSYFGGSLIFVIIGILSCLQSKTK